MSLIWRMDFYQTHQIAYSVVKLNPLPLNKEQDAFNFYLAFSFVLKILSNTNHQQKVKKHRN